MSADDHAGEDIGLQHAQHADEAGEGDRVEEYLAQDRALVAVSEPASATPNRKRVEHTGAGEG